MPADHRKPTGGCQLLGNDESPAPRSDEIGDISNRIDRRGLESLEERRRHLARGLHGSIRVEAPQPCLSPERQDRWCGPCSAPKPNSFSTMQTRSTRWRQPVRPNNVVPTHSSRSPQLPPRRTTRRSPTTPGRGPLPTLVWCRSGVPAETLIAYSMRRPEMARLNTSCWICSVPSKMSWVLRSRPRPGARRR